MSSLRSGPMQQRKVSSLLIWPMHPVLTRHVDQDGVIKALKLQISDLQSRTSDLTSLKKELTATSKDNARLISENKKLTDSLTAAQNETKNLSSKLAVARSSAQPESKNVPGSAAKPRTTGVVLPGTIEAAKEATLAKQKVDLYSDMTNLVILGLKKNEDDEDVYDCLQTGKNGSKSHLPSPHTSPTPPSYPYPPRTSTGSRYLPHPQPYTSTSPSPRAPTPTKTPSSNTNPSSTSSATRTYSICFRST